MSYQETEHRMVVDVACLRGVADLDPADRDPTGACAVDGAWEMVVAIADESDSTPEAVALRVFERHGSVARLEDYRVSARAWTEADDGAVRGTLGRYTEPLYRPLAARDAA